MAENAKNQAGKSDVKRTKRGQAGAQNENRDVADERIDVTVGRKPRIVLGDLAKETAALNASIDEEVDALRVDLVQDTRSRDTRDGTGKIVDELAEEHIAGVTEVGPALNDKGVVSAVPGRNNTSRILRRHHPNTEIARAQDVVEGNLEEPRDEGRMERKVDEGTAA